MKIRLFVRFNVKASVSDKFIEIMQSAKTELAKVPGCEAVELIQSLADPSKVILSEVWASKEIHDQYAARMAASGSMSGLAPFLDGEPELSEYFIK